jgi:hypothetical protein
MPPGARDVLERLLEHLAEHPDPLVSEWAGALLAGDLPPPGRGPGPREGTPAPPAGAPMPPAQQTDPN